MEAIVPCINYEPLRGYYFTYKTPLDTLMIQIAYAQKLVENELSEWNIEENQHAFWVFQNGMDSIADALERILQNILEHVEKQQNRIVNRVYLMSGIEMMLCALVLYYTVPVLVKSDKAHHMILDVFLSMPTHLIKYLEHSTENSLAMRQDLRYPDSRQKFKTQQEIWEDCMSEPSAESVSTKKLSIQRANMCKRLLRVLVQKLSKRVWLYILLALSFQLGLQMWYGNIHALEELSNATKIVKYIGTFNIEFTSAQLQLLNTVLSPRYADIANQTAVIYAELGNEEYTPVNFESSLENTLKRTELIRSYMKMFLLGNKELGISNSYIHSVQVEHFFEHFFKTECRDIVGCMYGAGIFSLPITQASQLYSFDVERICNLLLHSGETEGPQKWAYVQTDLFLTLDLMMFNIWKLMGYVETQVTSYYGSIFEQYKVSRIIVLSCFCTFSVIYYWFIFRRAVMSTEKKEQLTRNMLLLLPERIVQESSQVQRALLNISFD